MPQDPLKIETSSGSRPETTIIRLAGPLTIANLFGFQDILRGITSPLTVIDLANVPYMDSAGLGSVLNFYVSSNKQGRKMAVAAPNQRITALIELTKVNTVLKVFPTVDAAEAGM
ncbi:MAG: STAS domain-containing protein [Acidobacteriaceae bacterium]